MDPRRRLRLVRWLACCTLGEGLGLGLAAGYSITLLRLLGEPRHVPGGLAVLALGAAAGVIEGGILGVFQSRYFVTVAPDLKRLPFVSFTVAVAVLGWLGGSASTAFAGLSTVGDTATGPAAGPVVAILVLGGAAGGAAMGAVQLVALKPFVEFERSWIGWNALAWAVALPLILAGASWDVAYAVLPAWAVVTMTALAAGVAVALITAPAAVGTRARRVVAPQRDPAHAARPSDLQRPGHV